MDKELKEALLHQSLKNKQKNYNEVEPQFFDLTKNQQQKEFSKLFEYHKDNLEVVDEIDIQLKELMKIRHPKEDLTEKEFLEKGNKHLHNTPKIEYGVWVYYPWKCKVIHLLPENEFIELRTARNRYKITEEEQHQLKEKVVGIVGLSVGQSAALTMAIERIAGTLRLADFDHLELSNLNRLRTGLENLNVPKTTLVAREIAEIDPFLKVEIFSDGITMDNMDDFLDKKGHSIDLLVEECDSLPIKLDIRRKARAKGIPVVMDTSDRGMLDIERFDLEPNREILHGLISEKAIDNLDVMPEEQKIGLLFNLVGGTQISSRLKASFLELGQTLTSWPQLSSSVTLGGGLVTNATRRILLGHLVMSGRYYVDLDQLIPTEKGSNFKPKELEELSFEHMKKVVKSFFSDSNGTQINQVIWQQIVESGSWAPSSGNDQPWKMIARGNELFVFHDLSRSYSFGDHHNIAAYQSIGAAIENMLIEASFHDLKGTVNYFPKKECDYLVAIVQFNKQSAEREERLQNAIKQRVTNRKITPRIALEKQQFKDLENCISTFPKSQLKWITNETDRLSLGKIISACDKARVLHPWGHYDFFFREMRWTPQEVEDKRNGIDIRTLEIEPQKMAAIGVLKEPEVVDLLRNIDGGSGFDAISMEAAQTASAFGLLTIPSHDKDKMMVHAGRIWERLWLEATANELSVHPLISPIYLFEIANDPGQKKLSKKVVDHLLKLQIEFNHIWDIKDSYKGVFLFKLFKTDYKAKRTNRLPLNQIFEII